MWRLIRRACGVPSLSVAIRFVGLAPGARCKQHPSPVRRGPLAPLDVWLALAAAIGAGLYYLPPFLEGLSAFGLVLRRPQVWADYVAPMLLGPPFLVSAGWLVTVFLVLVIATVAGAVRGVWKSFFR